MNRQHALFIIVYMGCLASAKSVFAAPGVPADYNNDGIVSHADYSVLADHFNSNYSLANAGSASPGIVDQQDFDFYVSHYGDTSSLPGILPFTVVATPVAGNLQWTMTFSNLNGGLAGHLNIATNGPNIISATEGLSFRDDNDGVLEVPGRTASNLTQQGISFTGNHAFVALGTTLASSPALFNSNTTLEFVRLTTAGTAPMTLTYAGEYGYQSQDYIIDSSSTFVPEPSTTALVLPAVFFIWRRHTAFRRST